LQKIAEQDLALWMKNDNHDNDSAFNSGLPALFLAIFPNHRLF
jgi:hypothetical protein